MKFLLLLILFSCDAPRDRRNYPNSNDRGTTIIVQTPSYTSTPTQEMPNQNNNETPSPQNEFSHCSTSTFQYNHQLLGPFNLCKSSKNANKIMFQTSLTHQDYRICLFPISNDTSGTVMVGDAKCLFPITQRVETIQLSSNRPGFQTRLINGVIIVKDSPYGEVTPFHLTVTPQSPTFAQAFADCMIYLYQTGDGIACNRFRQKGQYIKVLF